MTLAEAWLLLWAVVATTYAVVLWVRLQRVRNHVAEQGEVIDRMVGYIRNISSIISRLQRAGEWPGDHDE